MICPRCKRPVSDSANFCGSCGLPRAEIERFYRQQELLKIQVPQAEDAEALADDLQSSLDDDNYNINDGIRTAEPEQHEPTGDSRAAFEEKEEKTSYEPVYAPEQKPQARMSYTYVPMDPPRAPSFDATDYEGPSSQTEEPLSTVDYIWMMILSAIPVFGFLYLIYLGFFQKISRSKSNYAKAALIVTIFAFLVMVLFFASLVRTFMTIYGYRF
ncbi:MAG: zinc ribbon domain-containing protein [Lachnospiraceae bacterium]|nr:zinc ribbon domain-containing protein [Lachnospiraceae bacterium]